MFVVVVILVAAFYQLHRADKLAKAGSTSSSVRRPYGTWLAVTGEMFQFRPDGTGRSYDPATPKLGIHFFEWSCDGSNLTLFYPPRGQIQRFIAYQTGVESTIFQLDKLTSDEMILSDGPAVNRFTSTSDAVLDADP